MRKKSLVLVLFIILLAASMVFSGCSNKHASEASPAAQAPSKADVSANEAVGAVPETTTAQLPNRKLIVKLAMEIRVEDVEKSILDTEAKAAAAGGYIRESYQNEDSAQLTLMIPAEKVEEFTASLKGMGKVINSNRNTEDVTDSYFDTQTRIKNLEAEIGTMRELLQKPGWKVSEILEIEREIRRLTDELESLKGYITNLDRQVTYSEIQIRFEKNQSAIDVGNEDSLGYKLKLALKDGIDLLVNMITLLLSFIVFILPLSPVIAIGYFLLRKPLRHLRKKDQQETKQ
jgi:hypothetical protein